MFVLIVSAIKTVESRSQLRVDTPLTQSESKPPDRFYRRVRVGLKSEKKDSCAHDHEARASACVLPRVVRVKH